MKSYRTTSKKPKVQDVLSPDEMAMSPNSAALTPPSYGVDALDNGLVASSVDAKPTISQNPAQSLQRQPDNETPSTPLGPSLTSELQADTTTTGLRVPITTDLISMLVPGMVSKPNPDLPSEHRRAKYSSLPDQSLYGSTNNPQHFDVQQGALGDCYLLSALLAIAKANPQFIKDMITDNGDGTYNVTLYENGVLSSNQAGKRTKKVVKVQATFPTMEGKDAGGKSSTKVLYAQPRVSSGNNRYIIWAMIIEKAYAQMEGGYDEISGSVFGGKKGFKAFTNAAVESHSVRDFPAKDLLTILDSHIRKGHPMTAGINKSINPFNWKLIDQLNIITGHEYALVGVDYAKQTVDLYNPWGFNHQNGLPIATFQKLFDTFSVAILEDAVPEPPPQ